MAKKRWESIILQQLSATLKRMLISTLECWGCDWSSKRSILMIRVRITFISGMKAGSREQSSHSFRGRTPVKASLETDRLA